MILDNINSEDIDIPANSDFAEVAVYIRKKINDWRSIPVNIGIIGQTGSGKSTFVNVMRGLTADDEGAASVGVNQTTMEPQSYPHPQNENFKLWDLPGVGTDEFPKEKYFDLINFRRYDFFLLLSCGRFSQLDGWLVDEIIKAGRKFYFVRTKVHDDCDSHMKTHPKTHNEATVLKKMQTDALQQVEKYFLKVGQDMNAVNIFLVDSLYPLLYDYNNLTSFLIDDFPVMKKKSLIFTLGCTSERIMEQKLEMLKSTIGYVGVASAGVAAIPIPGLSITADLIFIISELKMYYHQLGLDDDSLKRLAEATKTNVADLEKIRDTEFYKRFGFGVANIFTREGAIKLLFKKAAAYAVENAFEEVARYIPLIGTAIGAGLSFYTTTNMLRSYLVELHAMAKMVLKRAITGEIEAIVIPATAEPPPQPTDAVLCAANKERTSGLIQ